MFLLNVRKSSLIGLLFLALANAILLPQTTLEEHGCYIIKSPKIPLKFGKTGGNRNRTLDTFVKLMLWVKEKWSKKTGIVETVLLRAADYVAMIGTQLMGVPSTRHHSLNNVVIELDVNSWLDLFPVTKLSKYKVLITLMFIVLVELESYELENCSNSNWTVETVIYSLL